jgi:hypothetical protein
MHVGRAGLWVLLVVVQGANSFIADLFSSLTITHGRRGGGGGLWSVEVSETVSERRGGLFWMIYTCDVVDIAEIKQGNRVRGLSCFCQLRL